MGMSRASGHLYPPSESTGVGFPISSGDEVTPNRGVRRSVSSSRGELRSKPVLGTSRKVVQMQKSQRQDYVAIDWSRNAGLVEAVLTF